MSFPNMSDISYFIEVADTKNISRAAEKIGISQPSLSQAMQRLEKALDSNLIIRENRNKVDAVREKNFWV